MDASKKFEGFEEDYCLPSHTTVSRKGQVRIVFTRELVIDDLTEELKQEIVESGAIQLSIIDESGGTDGFKISVDGIKNPLAATQSPDAVIIKTYRGSRVLDKSSGLPLAFKPKPFGIGDVSLNPVGGIVASFDSLEITVRVASLTSQGTLIKLTLPEPQYPEFGFTKGESSLTCEVIRVNDCQTTLENSP